MFDIACVELENFRSYVGRHVFEIPSEPGLYLITGQHELQPRLGSNDIGKSTLLDAIFWCFYGRTSRGLKSGDVISWGERRAKVTVHLRVGKQALKITRTQSPNSLSVNGTEASQEDVDKHLRIGPDAFSYAVMLPQFGDSFFDLAPAAKLNLFSQIIELDYWLEKSIEAQAISDDLTASKARLNQQLAKYDGQIETMQADIANLSLKQLSFTDDKTSEIVDLKSELGALTKQIKFRKGETSALEKSIKDLDFKIKNAGPADALCSKCGQKLPTPEHHQRLKEKRILEDELVGLSRKLAFDIGKQESIQESVIIEEARVNPYADQISKKLANIKECKAAQANAIKELNGIEEDHAAITFWVAGFKRIRLFLVEETLRQLEIEVNNNMSALGLTDWRIEFDVERENKSGGVTKGFVVFVYAPGRAEPTRWEAWAGGVTQRLRLAGNLGLANLIMERAGLSNSVEFYDEPSQHLSQEGLLDVAETLQARALLGNKRIFIVDHNSIDFGGFAGRVLITKGLDGSRLTLG